MASASTASSSPPSLLSAHAGSAFMSAAFPELSAPQQMTQPIPPACARRTAGSAAVA